MIKVSQDSNIWLPGPLARGTRMPCGWYASSVVITIYYVYYSVIYTTDSYARRWGYGEKRWVGGGVLVYVTRVVVV